jgi:hypothetical protein
VVTISIEGLGEIPEVSDETLKDLDRPATIDHIEFIGAHLRSSGTLWRSSSAWALETIFDRDRLKAVIRDARALRINENIVDGAADWICDAWIKFRIRKKSKPPSQKLLKLREVLSGWVDDQSWEAFELSLCLAGPGDNRPSDAFARLTEEVGRLIKERRAGRKGRQEEALTTFLARLYGLYIAVSGETGLSDGCGPAYHFIKQCSALIDPTIVVPKRVRSTIQAKIARERAKSTTCKNHHNK